MTQYVRNSNWYDNDRMTQYVILSNVLLLQAITMRSTQCLMPGWKMSTVLQILRILIVFVTFTLFLAWIYSACVHWSPPALYRRNKMTFYLGDADTLHNAFLESEELLANQSGKKLQNVNRTFSINARKSSRNTDNTFQNNKCLKKISIYMHAIGHLGIFSYTELHNAFIKKRIPTVDKVPTILVECPSYECHILLKVSDSEVVLQQSNAIILNLTPPNLHGFANISETLIRKMPAGVLLIFYAMEPPYKINKWDRNFKDIMYHYSMSYHSSSDIYYPYGQYVSGQRTDPEDINVNFAENKTNLLVWTASNCMNTFWPRTAWVRSLQKLLPVDIYGRCGNLSCQPMLSPQCLLKQASYKFYLALENSPCEEYITEKFWLSSTVHGVVPIVYGGTPTSYERLAPPDSFIHISDFSSQLELVDYLKNIDRNDTLYNNFFNWRKSGKVINIYPKIKPEHFCRILPTLFQNHSTTIKTVRDSTYYKDCRWGVKARQAEGEDLGNWTPWKWIWISQYAFIAVCMCFIPEP